MSHLSPSALRFIQMALSSQDDPSHVAVWQAWASGSQEEIPSNVIQVALHALSGLALSIDRQLSEEVKSPMDLAVLENDLGYIADLEGEIFRHLH